MMGQPKTVKLLLVAGFLSVGLCSCLDKKDLYEPDPNPGMPEVPKVTLDDYFDFSTRKTVHLAIDYGLECPKAYFEIYAENPLTYQAEGSQVSKKPDLIAIGGGFANEKGSYNAPAVIPAAVSEVYIYSPDFGVPTLYKTQIVDGKISAVITFENQLDLAASSEGRSVQSRAAIEEVFPNQLGEWDDSGKPAYLDADVKITIDDKLQEYITTYFPDGHNNTSSYVSDDADLLIKEEADVWVNYFGGKTSAQSTFGYYCYQEGATIDEIKEASKHACVIFPNAHGNALGEYSGVGVRLRYIAPNGTLQDEEVGFPAGTKIGFLIWNKGWLGGNSSPSSDSFYSTKSLNWDGISHTALFAARDKNDNSYNVISMEDWTDKGTVEPDYNDVAFTITSNPKAAIDLPPLPDPGENIQGKLTYRGLLGYEDNWPDQGDYDMNDVVVKYISTVTYNTENNVVSIVDKFTLAWTGADFHNGFAYEVPFDLSNAEVVVSGATNASVSDRVIQLFTDAKSELGVGSVPAEEMPSQEITEKTYTVSIQFKERNLDKNDALPPYNPFVKRGRTEIHLTDYAPTANADNTFPKGADISTGENGTYFICEDGFPFAIHMDARAEGSMMNLNLKSEAVRIDQTYGGFAQWAINRDPTQKWW